MGSAFNIFCDVITAIADGCEEHYKQIEKEVEPFVTVAITSIKCCSDRDVTKKLSHVYELLPNDTYRKRVFLELLNRRLYDSNLFGSTRREAYAWIMKKKA